MKKVTKPTVVEHQQAPLVQHCDSLPQELLKLFLDRRAELGADLSDFNHAKYKGWFRYFGFSMEREHAWAKEHPEQFRPSDGSRLAMLKQMVHDGGTEEGQGRASSGLTPITSATTGSSCSYNTPSSPGFTVSTLATPTPGADTSSLGTTPIAGMLPTAAGPALCQDMTDNHVDPINATQPLLNTNPQSFLDSMATRIGEADRLAAEAGPMTGCSMKDIVQALVAPYATVTWRQDSAMCALLRARTIYRWLCHNIAVTLPLLMSRKDERKVLTFAADGMDTASPVASIPSGKTKKGDTGLSQPPPPIPAPMPPDTTAGVLAARKARPRLMADLFTDMLKMAHIGCITVPGKLKGCLDARGRPIGFMSWAWNIVTIPAAESTGQHELRFLVDVSLSAAFVGPRAGISPTGPAVSPGQLTPPLATGPLATDLDPCSEEYPYSISRPRWNHTPDLTPHFEPFYFGTDPRQFAWLHYPKVKEQTLLIDPPSRPVWESLPRLDHQFFRHRLQLESHCRRSNFQAKAAPFYISFLLKDCMHTELAAMIYKGSAEEQTSTDWNRTSTALGPGYVYTQRTEVEGRLTLTVMAPDVGLYTIVVGARRVNDSLHSAAPCNESFDIVCTYQVNLSFVAVNEPILAHQHLSPAFVKLIEPCGHKVTLGKQKFTVIPTSPAVMSVGVVNYLFNHRLTSIAGRAVGPATSIPVISAPPSPLSKGKKPSKGPAPVITASPSIAPSPQTEAPTERRLTLLDLNPATACYEGEVNVHQGFIEIWVLIGDPRTLVDPLMLAKKDKKERQATEAAAKAAAAAAADSAVMPLPTGRVTPKGKRSSVQAPPPPPPPPPPEDPANATTIRGRFVCALSGLAAVKRILPKEMGLNDGRGVIQPQLDGPRLYRDLPFVIRLVSELTDDGRTRTKFAESLIGRPLKPVGTYFNPV